MRLAVRFLIEIDCDKNEQPFRNAKKQNEDKTSFSPTAGGPLSSPFLPSSVRGCVHIQYSSGGRRCGWPGRVYGRVGLFHHEQQSDGLVGHDWHQCRYILEWHTQR